MSNGSIRPLVFLSHSSLDKPFVEKVAVDLRRYGIDCWYDGWDILPGDSLRHKIFEEGIQRSTCLLALITPNSINSSWVKRELDAALIQELDDSNAKLLPFVWRGDSEDAKELINELPLDIRSKNIGDLTDYVNGIIKIVAAVYQAKIRQTQRDIKDSYQINMKDMELQNKELELRIKELENQIIQLQIKGNADLKLFVEVNEKLHDNLFVKKRTIFNYIPGDETNDNTFTMYDMDVFRVRVDPNEVREVVEKYNKGYKFQPILKNIGSIIARNIIVEIIIPKPLKPNRYPPKLPSDRRDQFQSLPSMLSQKQVNEAVSLKSIDERSDSYRVRYSVEALNHTVDQSLPMLFLTFPNTKGLQQYELRYSIVSDSSERQSGQLVVGLDCQDAQNEDAYYWNLKKIIGIR